jgi:patatin-like phospholipase/acyl hydrolase
MTLRILSVGGGSSKGIYFSYIVENTYYLPTTQKKKIPNTFDIYAGCSIGSFIIFTKMLKRNVFVRTTDFIYNCNAIES